jgi:hypothetical protein
VKHYLSYVALTVLIVISTAASSPTVDEQIGALEDTLTDVVSDWVDETQEKVRKVETAEELQGAFPNGGNLFVALQGVLTATRPETSPFSSLTIEIQGDFDFSARNLVLKDWKLVSGTFELPVWVVIDINRDNLIDDSDIPLWNTVETECIASRNEESASWSVNCQ